MRILRKKNPAKVWQKILGLQKGNKVRVTDNFYYFSLKLRQYNQCYNSGIIKKGTLGEVIQIKDTPSKDTRLYRIQFPNIAVWCSDGKLELIIDG